MKIYTVEELREVCDTSNSLIVKDLIDYEELFDDEDAWHFVSAFYYHAPDDWSMERLLAEIRIWAMKVRYGEKHER